MQSIDVLLQRVNEPNPVQEGRLRHLDEVHHKLRAGLQHPGREHGPSRRTSVGRRRTQRRQAASREASPGVFLVASDIALPNLSMSSPASATARRPRLIASRSRRPWERRTRPRFEVDWLHRRGGVLEEHTNAVLRTNMVGIAGGAMSSERLPTIIVATVVMSSDANLKWYFKSSLVLELCQPPLSNRAGCESSIAT